MHGPALHLGRFCLPGALEYVLGAASDARIHPTIPTQSPKGTFSSNPRAGWRSPYVSSGPFGDHIWTQHAGHCGPRRPVRGRCGCRAPRDAPLSAPLPISLALAVLRAQEEASLPSAIAGNVGLLYRATSRFQAFLFCP